MSRHQTVLDTAHSTILPFTRYLAGHGDFTPTAFDPQELQGNSWGHELAQAVVFTSPYLCFGGHPKDYLANPGVDVLKMIPAAWDETRILPGTEPGKRVLSARRTGTTWFVGVLGGPEASQMTVDLQFLGQGRYNATILGDDASNPAAWDRREVQVTPTDQVSLRLRAKGGAVVRLMPSP
jgi:alpha-glucosidase